MAACLQQQGLRNWTYKQRVQHPGNSWKMMCRRRDARRNEEIRQRERRREKSQRQQIGDNSERLAAQVLDGWVEQGWIADYMPCRRHSQPDSCGYDGFVFLKGGTVVGFQVKSSAKHAREFRIQYPGADIVVLVLKPGLSVDDAELVMKTAFNGRIFPAEKCQASQAAM